MAVNIKFVKNRPRCCILSMFLYVNSFLDIFIKPWFWFYITKVPEPVVQKKFLKNRIVIFLLFLNFDRLTKLQPYLLYKAICNFNGQGLLLAKLIIYCFPHLQYSSSLSSSDSSIENTLINSASCCTFCVMLIALSNPRHDGNRIIFILLFCCFLVKLWT